MRKKSPFILSAVFVFTVSACQKVAEVPNDSFEPEVVYNFEASLLSIDAEPYYDPDAQAWLLHRADPYTLDNFNTAYRNVIDGKSVYSASLSIQSVPTELAPTHYNLKLYPKSRNMILELYQMDDIDVSSFPYNSILIPGEEVKVDPVRFPATMSTNISRSKVYYEFPEPMMTSDGQQYQEEPYILPVLYSVWPVAKQIPEDLDHEILYEVYLPEEDDGAERSLSTELMQAVEQEALILARGSTVQAATASGGIAPMAATNVYPKGKIYYYDDLLGYTFAQYQTVRIVDGSRVGVVYTDIGGNYNVNFLFPSDAIVSVRTQKSEWNVTDINSVSYEYNLGTVGTVSRIWNLRDINPIVVYQAAVKFFQHSPSFNTTMRKGNIVIKYQDVNGTPLFLYANDNHNFIQLYKEYRESRLFVNALHELGHAAMFGYKGYDNMKSADRSIREGWAVFVAWYMGDQYYKSNRWVSDIIINYSFRAPGLSGYCSACDATFSRIHNHPTIVYSNSVSYDYQRNWDKYSRDIPQYNPFFIDLIDDFNQREAMWYDRQSNYNNYPNDRIRNAPITIVEKIAFESKNRTDMKRIMSRYIGIYWTTTEMNDLWHTYDLNWVQ